MVYQKKCIVCEKIFFAFNAKCCSPECVKIKNKLYNAKYHKDYRLKNKNRLVQYHLEWRTKNKNKLIQYRYMNKVNLRKYQNEYNKKQYRENPRCRMRINLRNRINNALRLNSKGDSSIKLIGCSIQYLKEYLEKQFKPGMNWDNYNKKGWVIDHIIPCCSFDLSIISEQKKCFHYTNLQPLWWYENSEKISNDILRSKKLKSEI